MAYLVLYNGCQVYTRRSRRKKGTVNPKASPDYIAKRDTNNSSYRAALAQLEADRALKYAVLDAELRAKREALDAYWAARRDAIETDFDSQSASISWNWEARREALDAEYGVYY